MIVAIPLFGSRVSPRCLFSASMLVAVVEDGKLLSREIQTVQGLSEDVFLDQLIDLGVNVFICGGAGLDFVDEAEKSGVRVVNNVAGEVDDVLQAYVRGELYPGYGLTRGGVLTPVCEAGGSKANVVGNCISCEKRSCLSGGFCDVTLSDEIKVIEDPGEMRLHEVAQDVAFEEESNLCRVAEVVHFATGMGYTKLGVAFCVELFREAEILNGILDRFFQVHSVCCRIGGQGEDAWEEKRNPHTSCNAVGQAEALNRIGTDLNIVVGLCVGCDILFNKHSIAPATTLFVKDKSLANNPVGALYSRYYMDDLTGAIRKRKNKRVM